MKDMLKQRKRITELECKFFLPQARALSLAPPCGPHDFAEGTRLTGKFFLPQICYGLVYIHSQVSRVRWEGGKAARGLMLRLASFCAPDTMSTHDHQQPS
jgi:hypothetical protein